ncbi:hypothetical protein PSTG_13252 [Puccinia striiformis f. sp. tritici PST-78]|uniref:PD-(D/E)XK nuclease family transposase n=1 Tax=Puccinia striiformis f. sp. tritici PST-78 TaxID=1165861 RepID=A0A0L0V2A9_9BASI|nr:hypothetical protein PSTG_13252 [Puccinia striiformis f. sp. tritici PST-78]
MSSPSAINTQSLISPISNTAFEKLLKQPTLLIPFLNSILAEKFLITAIEETSKVVSIAPDALETLGTAVSDATSEQHAQASATSKLEYSYDKNADYDESNGIVRYDIVAKTDQNTVVEIELQRAYEPYDFDRSSYYSSRLIRNRTEQNMRLEKVKDLFNPVYIVSICDFGWNALPSVPDHMQNCWRLWVGWRWTDPFSTISVQQEMPASQFCYISLPTFRSVQGDSVDKNNALEKIIWILANTGRKSALRSLPEWVESDPFIKSFVDQLRYDTLNAEEKFDHDVAETSGTEDRLSTEYAVTRAVMVERERSRQLLRGKGLDPSIIDELVQ